MPRFQPLDSQLQAKWNYGDISYISLCSHLLLYQGLPYLFSEYAEVLWLFSVFDKHSFKDTQQMKDVLILCKDCPGLLSEECGKMDIEQRTQDTSHKPEEQAGKSPSLF